MRREPGDLILISPGTYKEGVTVETEDLVIRGADRNTVIIDGEFTRENGIKILADGVAVENLTARNNTANGVFWTGSYEDDYVLKGYRASYVTAYNNGLYGVYAFNAVERTDRAQLRLGPSRFGLLHRPVQSVRRGHPRRDRRAEHARVLGHELLGQHQDRLVGVAQQPRRNRSELAQGREVGAPGRQRHRRQPRRGQQRRRCTVEGEVRTRLRERDPDRGRQHATT